MKIVNKLLLSRDKFMPERHLKKPGSIYSACGLTTKNKERIQKFMQTGKTGYIYTISQISYYFRMNFIKKLLKNLKEEEFVHHLKAIFGV